MERCPSGIFHNRFQDWTRTWIIGCHAVLGKVEEYVVQYECQHRGSLHAHILLWLAPEDFAAAWKKIVAYIPNSTVDANGKLLPPNNALQL